MKKFIWIALILCFAAVGMFACAKKDKIKSDSELSTCAHEDELISFVTNRTETPFAAEYTCSICGRKVTRSFGYEEIDIPLVEIKGNLDGISKEDKVRATIRYQSAELSFEKKAMLKWQGNSSLEYPKKNYSVTLYDSKYNKKEKIAVKEEWGAQSKYCLKSNYVDPSGARNLVLSDLYGEVARSRISDDPFKDLPNGGAVDGFLILLYHNGQYLGLYNWNIPRDKWLFGMGDEDAGEAILCGDIVEKDGVPGITLDENEKDHWEIEYCNEKFSEGKGESWCVDSFNEMLSFVKNADGETLRAQGNAYLNMDRTLDVLLFLCVFGVCDNLHSNMVWCTYDGKAWAPIPYDLDRTLGRDGTRLYEAKGLDDFKGLFLYGNIFVTFYEELRTRYFAFRETLFTTEHVSSLISENIKGVDDRYFRSEFEKWEEADWRETLSVLPIGSFDDELKYIKDYLDQRFAFCDEIFAREELMFDKEGRLFFGEN